MWTTSTSSRAFSRNGRRREHSCQFCLPDIIVFNGHRNRSQEAKVANDEDFDPPGIFIVGFEIEWCLFILKLSYKLVKECLK